MSRLSESFDRGRNSGGREPNRRFILVFEGYRTEVEYFKGVGRNRDYVGIPSSLVDVCVLSRLPQHSGHSDPFRLLDLLDGYMDLLRTGRYVPELFVNMFLSSIEPGTEYEATLAETAVSELRGISDTDGRIMDLPGAFDICNRLYSELLGPDRKITELDEPVDFIDGRDVVCVIIDRDRENRSSSKCGDFISRCNESGYLPFMTNPCFEMWLLLHFEEALHIDRKDLLSDRKEDGKRYTERMLDDILLRFDPDAGYDKTCLDFGRFMHRIDDAIYNEKMFCHDIKCIRSEVGSNIGSLMEMMRRRS